MLKKLWNMITGSKAVVVSNEFTTKGIVTAGPMDAETPDTVSELPEELKATAPKRVHLCECRRGGKPLCRGFEDNTFEGTLQRKCRRIEEQKAGLPARQKAMKKAVSNEA